MEEARSDIQDAAFHRAKRHELRSGGGGCMITLAEPSSVPQVRQALAQAGARILPATLVGHGLRMHTTP